MYQVLVQLEISNIITGGHQSLVTVMACDTHVTPVTPQFL